jgi:hypothetical protein
MIKRKSGARPFVVALQGGTRYELAFEVIDGFLEH